MPLAAAISESPSVLPPGLLQRLVDQVHAVVAADREDVGVALVVVVKRLGECLALRGLVVVVEVRGGHDADRDVAHALERAFVGQHVLAQDPRLLRVDAALGERLADGRRLRAAGNPDVDRVGVGLLGALDEGEKSGFATGKRTEADDLAAGLLTPSWNAASASWPGPKSETIE
jgi:hypothetical protein